MGELYAEGPCRTGGDRNHGPRLKKAPLAKGAKLAQIWPEAATPALPLTRDVPAK
jgi:hypothetical protein